MALLLGLGMMKQRNSQACWSPNERTRQTEKNQNVPVLFSFFFLPPKEHGNRASGGDFPCSWGAYLNWICCWLKWIGPISQLLITRSWGQMDESSERTLSLILSPLMCCGILGCRRGKKEDGRGRWPFGPSYIYTDICTHSHTRRFIQEAPVTLGCGSNWFHGGRENEIKNNRKVWRRVFS